MTDSTARSMLVVSHTARPEAIEATIAVTTSLAERGVRVVMTAEDETEFAPYLPAAQIHVLDSSVPLSEIEIAIVLGGDGTILRAAEIVRESSCPIIGVNLGHVGFLAEKDKHDLAESVQRVLDKDYTVEERATLDVLVTQDGKPDHRTFAVNEATVEKRERMIEVTIGVDGKPLSTFGCDGVVMSTPTGSTAYAFSAGGPVMWPSVQGLLLVPLAAHALFNRPIVVGPDSVLETQVSPTSSAIAALWCDGRRKVELDPGAKVEVRTSTRAIRLARLDRAVFTDRLVSKFRLPTSGWREHQK